MRVLLTNDDGIYAQGLWAIYNRLAGTHHVDVIAPDRERSAIGHAITLHQPLRATRISLNGGFSGYAVNGTPAYFHDLDAGDRTGRNSTDYGSVRHERL